MNTTTASVRIPFAVIVLAMLPAVLDQTILSTALPTIAADLGSLSDLSWVVTAYVVAAASTTPLWGKLGDRYGRKALLEIALAGFVATSALCGLARDIDALVVVRAAQGVAAGGLMTLAMASVGDLVSPRQRGRYQGYIAATFAMATVVGPLLGGLLVEHASWRLVFYVNLPIGLVALVGLHSKLPEAERAASDQPLDALGPHCWCSPRRPSCWAASSAAIALPGVPRRSCCCSAPRSPSQPAWSGASGAHPIRSFHSVCCGRGWCRSRAPRSSWARPRCSP